MATVLTQKGLESICQASTVPWNFPLVSWSTSHNVGGESKLWSGPPLSGRMNGRLSWRKGVEKFQRHAIRPSKAEPELSIIEHVKGLSVLSEFREASATPDELLQDLADAMVAEFVSGLGADSGTDLKMLPAYLEHLPNGDECGCFYALDLGGTNFRVIRAEFGGKDGRLLRQEFNTFTIPPDLMVGKSDDLFDFLAGKLADFISVEEELHHDAGKKRELGFTFSFPVQQHSLASGTLIHWSKGFKVEGTVGEDVVEVLRKAIRRRGLDLEVTALVNDTVGTLAKGRYWSDDVMVAVILGTGTNACYVESAEAVTKWHETPPASGCHVINTEWGNFNSSLLPTTFADHDLDRESVNPGEHIFEKLVSGLYLGEIVRRVVLKIAEEGGLFGGHTSKKLSQKFVLTTPHVSKVHGDRTPNLDVAGEILSEALGITLSTFEERRIFRSIIETVTERGARLAAAGLVAILKQIGRVGGSNGQMMKRTIVAMDGGLFEHYSQFRECMSSTFTDLVGKDVAKNISISLSKDGSGVGAALIAASNSLYRKR